MTALLGVDVGGTSTEAVVLTDGIDVAGRSRVPTAVGTPDRIIGSVLEAVHGALASAGVATVEAAGVGVPGIVDDATGSTRHAVNLGIDDEALDIGAALSRALGVPSHVENDARTAAHGAFTLARREDPDLDSLAYVSIGTGISAGFVLGGELFRGAGGNAGEIGHVVADPAGPRCNCGLDGCLEAIASGGAAARWGDDGRGMSALFDAAATGDPAAAGTAGHVAAVLARALYGLVLSHDVARIVLGGGVVHHTPALVTATSAAMRVLEAASPLAADLSPTSRISIADPAVPIGAIGAAALAARRWVPVGSALDNDRNDDTEKGE